MLNKKKKQNKNIKYKKIKNIKIIKKNYIINKSINPKLKK